MTVIVVPIPTMLNSRFGIAVLCSLNMYFFTSIKDDDLLYIKKNKYYGILLLIKPYGILLLIKPYGIIATGFLNRVDDGEQFGQLPN